MRRSFRKPFCLTALAVLLLTPAALLLTVTPGGRAPTEAELTLAGPEEVSSLAFSPDGRTLAVGYSKGSMKLWDAAIGEERRTFRAHADTVWSLAFSPDGKLLASASRDTTVRLWDAATDQETGCLGHDDWVHCLAFSPDGRTLAARAGDGTVTIWDLTTRTVRHVLRVPIAPLGVSIAFSPDGATLASAHDDGTVRLWDPGTGTERARLFGHATIVRAITFSPDGQSLATASMDGTARHGSGAWPPGKSWPPWPGTRPR